MQTPQPIDEGPVTGDGFAAQAAHEVRFEWGFNGVTEVANAGGVSIIVDVLSFTTCVDIACARGARVYPYRYRDGSADAFARAKSARLATDRSDAGGPSLSPRSLLELAPGESLVLASPNGSTLALACTAPVVLAGCLRNAAAVAAYAARFPGPVSVVAAGEHWADASLRPCIEDLLGAGAIIHHLDRPGSPEAELAAASFTAARPHLGAWMTGCASSIELIERGYSFDVQLAAELNSSLCVPRLLRQAFVRAQD